MPPEPVRNVTRSGHRFRNKLATVLGGAALLAALWCSSEPSEEIEMPEANGMLCLLEDRSPSVWSELHNRHQALRSSLLRRGLPAGAQIRTLSYGKEQPVLVDLQSATEATRLLAAPSGEEIEQRTLLLSDGRWEGPMPQFPEGIRTAPQRVGTNPPETVLLSLHVPQQVDHLAPFQAVVELSSNSLAPGRILLRTSQGQSLATHPVVPASAGGRFTFDRLQLEEGTYELVASYEGPDTYAENNEIRARLVVSPGLRILRIGPTGQGVAKTNPLVRALETQGIRVESVLPQRLSDELLDLASRRVVLLDGIEPDELSRAVALRLVQAILTQGLGLFVVAGGVGRDPSGWNRSPLSEVLPVHFIPSPLTESAPPSLDSTAPPSPDPTTTPPLSSSDPPPAGRLIGPTSPVERVEIPRAALILAIDKSGSMAGEKMLLAKEAAIATTRLLSPHDWIGVVAFDQRAHWVIRPMHVMDPEPIARQIARLSSGGDTNMHPAILEARNALRALPAHLKHVVVLTDGFTALVPLRELVESMVKKDRITLSAIGIGEGFDYNLLSRLSLWGHGTFDFTVDTRRIPQLVVRDARRVLRRLESPVTRSQPSSRRPHEVVVPQPGLLPGSTFPSASTEPKHPISPFTARPTSALSRWRVVHEIPLRALRGVEPLPPLHGCHPAEPRPGGTVYLRAHPLVEPRSEGKSDGRPLLVGGRFGAGRVVTFTSASGGTWARPWLDQPAHHARFWTQLLRWLAPRPRPSLRLFTRRLSGQAGRVHLKLLILDESEDSRIRESRLEITIHGSDGPIDHTLVSLGEGLYWCEFPLPSGSPPARLETSLVAPGMRHLLPTTLVSAEPDPEYSRIDDGRDRLARIGREGGGIEPAPETLSSFPRRVRRFRVPWDASLLALPIALYLLALLVRPPKP